MNEDFEYMVEKFGSPDPSERAGPEVLARYEGQLPPSLLDFWRECGIGLWLGGKFQFCDPGRYRSIVNVVLAGDPQFDPARTHAYGYTAFGELRLWSQDNEKLDINLPLLSAASLIFDPDWEPSDPDLAIASSLTMLDKDNTADFREDSPKAPLMFAKVRKALGELELGEVYGFVPALELGGVARVENVRRVRALEHFAILAQLGPVKLFDYSTGEQRFVRNLGGG